MKNVEQCANEIYYSNSTYNNASLYLSQYLDNGSEALDQLIIDIKNISLELSERIQDVGINVWVLWNDRTCASQYYQDRLQIDTEEWYSEDKKLADIYKSLNEETQDKIRDCIGDFEENLYREILDQLDVSPEVLDQLALVS